MAIQEMHINWLTTVPASDINFESHLRQANADTLRAALTHQIGKTAAGKIEAQLKRLAKS